jgi:hypothetical protein
MGDSVELINTRQFPRKNCEVGQAHTGFIQEKLRWVNLIQDSFRVQEKKIKGEGGEERARKRGLRYNGVSNCGYDEQKTIEQL